MQSIKNHKSKVIALTLIYVISHWLLCVISGQWWDDWGIWLHSLEELKVLFWEMGLPWEAYNLLSVMWIPNWGYRIVVFLLFLITGLLFYGILCKVDFFTEEDAFWIAAIAVTVPVNDARSTLICYGYSLSLVLFMTAFFIVVKLREMSGRRKTMMRILSLLLLLYSYTMESLLVFTGLIWLYLFYTVWRENSEKRITENIFAFFRSGWDYFIVPFAFFIIKNIFFKPYGRYANYNSVTFRSLVTGIWRSPLAAINTGLIICRSYVKQIGYISLLMFLTIAFIFLFMDSKLIGGVNAI